MKTLTDLKNVLEKDVATLEKFVKATQTQLDKVNGHIACLKGYVNTIENFEKDLIAKNALSYPKTQKKTPAKKRK